MKKINYLFVLISFIFLIGFISSLDLFHPDQSAWKNMTSDEKLIVCIDAYNNCTDDYYSGKNCGIVYEMLNDNNRLLLSKVENHNVYKYSSFVELGIIFILGIFLIRSTKKGNGRT